MCSLCLIKHLQVFECLVSGQSVIEDQLFSQYQGGYVLLAANTSPKWKSNKIQICLLCCGGCRAEGNLWLNFKFERFYSYGKVLEAHSKVTVTLPFSIILLCPVKTYSPLWEPLPQVTEILLGLFAHHLFIQVPKGKMATVPILLSQFTCLSMTSWTRQENCNMAPSCRSVSVSVKVCGQCHSWYG